MPFNGTTYRMNQAKKFAWDHLAEARRLKARVEAGEAYDWEVPMVEGQAKSARFWNHQYLSWRKIRASEQAYKKGK